MIISMKNSNDSIETRNRHLLDFSAVQPTGPPNKFKDYNKYILLLVSSFYEFFASYLSPERNIARHTLSVLPLSLLGGMLIYKNHLINNSVSTSEERIRTSITVDNPKKFDK